MQDTNPTPTDPHQPSRISRLGAGFALALLVAVAPGAPGAALAANGDCAQPLSNGDGPNASDCLFILKVAVGQDTCSPACICAPGGSLPTKASDALRCLRNAVGQDVSLDCPCVELPDGDDFNDSSKDPARWGPDFLDGNGELLETGAVLRYTCDSGTEYDQSLRDWIGSNFPYDADWEVQLDVANFTIPDQNDQVNSFGLSIVDHDFFGNEIFAELYASHLESPPARNGFYAALYDNESFVSDVDTGSVEVVQGAIRVAFDASTKVLTLSYDLLPQNGYTWVEFGSFGIDGSGGADDNVDWDLTDDDTFQVAVYGYSSRMTVGPGTLYGDNFGQTGGVPVP